MTIKKLVKLVATAKGIIVTLCLHSNFQHQPFVLVEKSVEQSYTHTHTHTNQGIVINSYTHFNSCNHPSSTDSIALWRATQTVRMMSYTYTHLQLFAHEVRKLCLASLRQRLSLKVKLGLLTLLKEP